jgi:hypothetical protein
MPRLLKPYERLHRDAQRSGVGLSGTQHALHRRQQQLWRDRLLQEFYAADDFRIIVQIRL